MQFDFPLTSLFQPDQDGIICLSKKDLLNNTNKANAIKKRGDEYLTNLSIVIDKMGELSSKVK